MLCKVLRRGSGVARLEAVLVRGGSGYFLAAVAPIGWSTGDTKLSHALDSVLRVGGSGFNLQANMAPSSL